MAQFLKVIALIADRYMKLPNNLRINKTDYPEESRDIVDKLAASLNPSIDALFNLGNNRVSLKDNVFCVVNNVTVTVDDTGAPTTSTGISIGSTVKTVLGSTVLAAQNQTNSNVYPTAQPFISFTQNGSTFVLNNVAGLPTNNKFTLTIVVWGA